MPSNFKIASYVHARQYLFPSVQLSMCSVGNVYFYFAEHLKDIFFKLFKVGSSPFSNPHVDTGMQSGNCNDSEFEQANCTVSLRSSLGLAEDNKGQNRCVQ